MYRDAGGEGVYVAVEASDWDARSLNKNRALRRLTAILYIPLSLAFYLACLQILSLAMHQHRIHVLSA